MLCEKCRKNEATVHMTQFMDGRVGSVHLCEECASAMGVDVQGGTVDMGRLLEDIRRQVEEVVGETARREKALAAPQMPSKCPQCGMRREEIRRTGNPGCPHCYETFRAVLLPEPDELGTYQGWRPKEFPEGASAPAGAEGRAEEKPGRGGEASAELDRERREDAHRRECRRALESKQRRLEEAVEAERYEKAAQLRDEIQSLRKELEAIGEKPADGDGAGEGEAEE
jgi:protein arginine kinase activator